MTMTSGRRPGFTVADRLRKARESAGFEQAALARVLGVAKNTVSNYERGAVQPKRAVVMAWAMATDTALDWLEGESPRPEDGGSHAVRPKGLEPPTFWTVVPAPGTWVLAA
jgi:transcriptional regulator with XRE-family HTH domain